MSGAPTPPVLLDAIASTAPNGATPGGKTNPMPDAPPGGNAASVQGGFPANTMESELAGGKPPFGQDMNGFLFLLSSHTLYVECGQTYQYNASLASEIGGYAVGTILGMADGSGEWLNTADANTSNPDAGGSGWVPLAAYGVTSVSTSGGTLTLSAAQARYPVIVVTGALVSNLAVILPNRYGSWLMVNATTGAFTMTARTSSGTGTGVTVPQGGPSSPVGAYCIADGNIYPTVSPLSVPIDQEPNPLTLVERTNDGYVLATYFNQDSGVETPTIANVIVDDGDGFFRKISKVGFGLQLSPGLLTGPGPWWEKRPSGVIEAWGQYTYTTVAGAHIVSFPPGLFTTVVQGVWLQEYASVIGWDTWILAGSISTSGFQIFDDASGTHTVTILWRATGY